MIVISCVCAGQLTRAAVELAKMWRMDKYLRRLDVRRMPNYLLTLKKENKSTNYYFFLYFLVIQAALIVADKTQSLQITGNGDVLEPHDGIIAIGSGSPYALAAARALIDIPGMDARQIAEKAMHIAADACIYTNHAFTALHIDKDGKIDDLNMQTDPLPRTK